MEFTVKFSPLASYAISVFSREIGIKDIDEIRDACKFDVPIDRIKSTIGSITKDPEAIVGEEKAKKIPQFERKNKVIVKVESSSLNDYVFEYSDCIQDKKTGEITSAYKGYAYDVDKIVDDWIDQGCPDTWDKEMTYE